LKWNLSLTLGGRAGSLLSWPAARPSTLGLREKGTACILMGTVLLLASPSPYRALVLPRMGQKGESKGSTACFCRWLCLASHCWLTRRHLNASLSLWVVMSSAPQPAGTPWETGGRASPSPPSFSVFTWSTLEMPNVRVSVL
jgi:hypothetical protein